MLNSEQQKIIVNSLWVVNSVMKELGLQGNADMYSLAYLFLCDCIEKFDPERGVKWTTYAYKSLTLYMKREYAKEMKRQNKIVSEQQLFYIKDDTGNGKQLYYQMEIGKLKEHLTDRELTLLELKLQDKPIKEICEIMGLSHTRIETFWNEIKDKALDYLENPF